MTSQSNNKVTEAESLNADEVAQYLNDNPDFFTQRSDLLASLELPHDSGSAISLVERQVSLLRERNIETRHRLSHLLDTARDNDQLLDKTQRLILSLIEADDLDELGIAISDSLLHQFKADACSLVLFEGENNYPSSNLRTVPMEDAKKAIGGLIQLGKPICGALREAELHYLFADSSKNVKSAAVMPLGKTEPIGFLAIGSADAERFHQNMGTVFLDYLAEVLIRLLPKFSEE